MKAARFLIRYASALVVMVSAWLVYSLLAVPWIEGESQPVSAALVTFEGIRLPEEIKSQLTGLVPPDGWEWQPDCNILESPQARLFFRDYQTDDDGSVHLEPLTMVLTPRAPTGTSESPPPPIVLRAPGGARLKFEQPLSLETRPGRLEHGQFRGEVQIYRNESSPGAEDGIALVTSNVQLSPERIFTLYDCRFRFGKNFGNGRRMTIDLFGPAATPDARQASAFADVERIEIGSVDQLYLHRDAVATTDTAAARETDMLDGSAGSLYIRSRGPMVFESTAQRLSFSEQVRVQTADGQSQLDCETLTVQLREADGQSEEGIAGKRRPHLEISRLTAAGAPVRLVSQGEGAEIVAEQVDFDLARQTVVLESSGQVVLVRNGQRIVGPWIRYTYRDDGRLGTAEIRGAGWIEQTGDEPGKSLICQWRDGMTLQDDESQMKVLSLDDAEVHMSDMRLKTSQLHFWMHELASVDGKGQTRYRLHPARMLAAGNVEIATAEMEGTCSEAGAYWPEPNAVAVATPSSASPGQPASRYVTTVRRVRQEESGMVPVAPRPGSQEQIRSLPLAPPTPTFNAAAPMDATQPSGRTRFSGTQIQLQMRGGDEPGAVDEISVNDNVVVQQLQTAENGLRTVLEIRGQRLRALSRGETANRLLVLGTPRQPASVAASGIRLLGVEVHLDQRANRLWVDGPGEMQLLPEDRESGIAGGGSGGDSGATPQVRPDVTTVHWQGGMVFDGEKLYFETDVQTHSRQAATDGTGGATTTTSVSAALSIVLNQRIDFTQADEGNRENRLEAEKLVMVGWLNSDQAAFPETWQASDQRMVWIAAGRYDAQGQLFGNQELFAPRASVRIESGDATCQGPGTVVVRQLAGSQNGQPTATRLEGRAGTIDFVRVNFDGRFEGNFNERRLDFFENVHALYTGARDWDHVPEETVLTQPDARGLVLDCDQLVVAQWTPQGSQPVIDMTATGNARVRGTQFDAAAERVSYFEGNNQVVIEAPSRGDAEFWFTQPGQTSRGHMIARRITYNLETGTYEVDEMKKIDYSQSEAAR